MFDSKSYKLQARSILKKNWNSPCIVTFVSMALIACLMSTADINIVMKAVMTGTAGIIFIAQLALYEKTVNSGKIFNFPEFIEEFKNWQGAILGTIWFFLWTSLWSLLFFIPGVVKGISYSMMFWIIAENPEISVRKAMDISKIMTLGHKSDLFCMFMSFSGWIFLSLISGGIGFIWLVPYMNMSFTKAYYELKKTAFETKIIKPADFGVEE